MSQTTGAATTAPVTEVPVTAIPATEIPTSVTPASSSPAVLLFNSSRGGDYMNLFLMSLDGTNIIQLTDGSSNVQPCGWSPDGSKILFTGWNETESFVGIMNADGSGVTNLSKDANISDSCGSFSADGSKIVFTSYREENNDIYVMTADGSWQARLTKDKSDDFDPVWSPVGSMIAFVSDRDRTTGENSIYIMADDGSNVRRLTYSTTRLDISPAWSPDGAQIAFRGCKAGICDIYVVNVSGGDPVNLTNGTGDNSEPSWSPDGKQIFFASNRDGNPEIYVMNADGSDQHNLTNDPAIDAYPYLKP
jgi:Tol biopolymer transport system component